MRNFLEMILYLGGYPEVEKFGMTPSVELGNIAWHAWFRGDADGKALGREYSVNFVINKGSELLATWDLLWALAVCSFQATSLRRLMTRNKWEFLSLSPMLTAASAARHGMSLPWMDFARQWKGLVDASVKPSLAGDEKLTITYMSLDMTVDDITVDSTSVGRTHHVMKDSGTVYGMTHNERALNVRDELSIVILPADTTPSLSTSWIVSCTRTVVPSTTSSRRILFIITGLALSVMRQQPANMHFLT